MIAVSINQGIGNQMFQYAFAFALSKKGHKVYVDTHSYVPNTSMTCETTSIRSIFPNLSLKETPRYRFLFLFPKFGKTKYQRYLKAYLRKYFSKLKIETYIDEPSYGYCPNVFSQITKNCIFYGLWQSDKYFAEYESDLRQQYVFPSFTEELNIRTATLMSQTNSIAIHIRKGIDYQKSELLSNGGCNLEYYKNAIQYINDHVENPVYYIFTDNQDWVEKNITFINYTIINWNPVDGNMNYRDMQLMTYAKHVVIANSSYSWWGAWLNNNRNKIVIAPKLFHFPIDDFFKRSDIICNNWITF